MKDYSEKADSNLAGKLGFRQEEIMPLSNWNSQFHTCGMLRAIGMEGKVREARAGLNL